ncbi:hypothetical protein CYY_000141 [Polysphondylium violaceum]|uniref:Pyridoxal phosphate homeostasis protein n=1 Tax=Polysphondylium violaceum TaxID=133409 RepID=A0A8J4Q2B8_9MYCE|nr:hypothetical protein CYY_000141 [Polysphondylium violaceum]
MNVINKRLYTTSNSISILFNSVLFNHQGICRNSSRGLTTKQQQHQINMNETQKKDLIENFRDIKSKVDAASSAGKRDVTLVAVSKTKPAEMIKVLYKEAGHRHFGENYIQELITKSEELGDELGDVKWHFIGSIQSNKAKMLASVKNLYVVETIERVEIVDKLAKAWNRDYALNVMVQVNTSNEESKSGCKPDQQLIDIVQHITQSPLCKDKIHFLGLMTIGDPDASADQPDFKCLVQCKEMVSQKLNIPLDSIQLSMGMSHDFEQAIEFGSTSVRVGSAIFGERNYSKK